MFEHNYFQQMKNYLLKLKYILLPFLFYMIIATSVYTLFNWLFCIKLEWINLREEIINIFIPMAIAVIVPLFFMKKSINRLKFKEDKTRDGVYAFAMIGICVPLIIAQHYITTATGDITHLRKISEIDKLPKTKYYLLDNSFIYKKGANFKTHFETSGKNNNNLNFYIYTVIPIFDKPQDTISGETHQWFCLRYADQISNFKSDAEKETAFKAFALRSEKEFEEKTFSFTYLERLKNESDAKYYALATNTNEFFDDTKNVLLIPQEGNYKDRNGKSLVWIFKSAGIAILLIALLLLCYRLKTPGEWNQYNKKVEKEKRKGWRKNYEYLIPQGSNFFLPLLCYANIFVFLWLVISDAGFVSFDSEDLIKAGSLYKPYILIHDQYWRLFTYMFLHGGLMHLTNNIVSLIFVSIFLEPLLGRWKFFTLYIVCGFGAGLTSLYWHENINGVGASGAIFGLYGFMLMMVLMKVTDESFNRFFLMIASISLGLTLIMGFMLSGIDNAAHIGGLITGALIGLLTYNQIKQKL